MPLLGILFPVYSDSDVTASNCCSPCHSSDGVPADVVPVEILSGFFLPAVAGCVSGKLFMTIDPPSAEIRVVDSLAGARAQNAGKLVGKGSASLNKTDFTRKLFMLSAEGYEPLAFFVPEVGGDDQVKIVLPKEDGRLAREVASLRSDLEAERKTNALLKENLLRQSQQRHTVGQQLVQAQKFLSLAMNDDAEFMVNELFKVAEDVLPSAAFVLRGKLRIAQGRLQDARADLQKAVELNPGDKEASALLETVK